MLKVFKNYIIFNGIQKNYDLKIYQSEELIKVKEGIFETYFLTLTFLNLKSLLYQ